MAKQYETVIGLPPNAVEQPQNIFVFVASST